MTSMNLTEEQRAWVDALRSGNYEQGRNYLAPGGRFCCLGVACDLFKEQLKIHVGQKSFDESIVTYDDEDTGLPYPVQKLLNVKSLSVWIDPRLTKSDLERCLATTTDRERYETCSELEYRTLADLNDDGFSFGCIANVIEKYPERIFENEKTEHGMLRPEKESLLSPSRLIKTILRPMKYLLKALVR